MTGLTDYITDHPWVEVFTVWYVLIDDAYQAILADYGRRLRPRGPEPRFSDSEVITLALIIDTYFHGHEALGLAFVRQYHPAEFPQVLSPSRFNRRRRLLVDVIEAIRTRLTTRLIDPADRLRLIDSAPIPMTTYTRGPDCRTVQGWDYCGVCISKRQKVFGFKLHLLTTADQVVDQWLVAPASYHDSTVAPAVLEDRRDLLVPGDKAYVRPEIQRTLQEGRRIVLLAPPRRTDRVQWVAAQERRYNRVRRRIETALSVLTVVFNVERPGSRSLAGALCRIATRILAYTLSFRTTHVLASLN